ncbi:uncharacterized protein LOC141652405 [Silene latifolia]|uniref:uncharacterized protein LOC141652405 n=1 Tax=Silene latifolia TaxID=37657 RepID=UPI003D785C12
MHMASIFPLFTMLLLFISSASPSLSSRIQKFTAMDDRAAAKPATTSLSPRLLDLAIRDLTVSLFDKENFKTGVLNNVRLPTNFSGIEVNAARFRCGSIRRYGANMKEFRLGKGVIINPCLERVIFIKQELGLKFSTIYYNNYNNLQGYELVTPILGLFAYNGGDDLKNTSSPNPFELRVIADKDPIVVDFTNVTRIISTKISLQGKMLYCASFGEFGNVTLASLVAPNVCHAKKDGHIGLVINANQASSLGQGQSEEYNTNSSISRWKVVLGSSIGAALGAFLLGLLFVAMFAKAKKRSKLEELVRQAYEEEALEVSMVGHVRAPVAPTTRTVPIIEHHYRPSPRSY